MTTERRTRVFIVSPLDGRLDSANLPSFGEIIPLTDKNETSLFRLQETIDTIRDALEKHEFDPERDIVAISGDFVRVVFMVGLICAEYTDIRVAIYVPQKSEYRLEEVTV